MSSQMRKNHFTDRDVIVLKTIPPPVKMAHVPVLTVSKVQLEKNLEKHRPGAINWDTETLKLECWTEELSPTQIERRMKVNKELEEVQSKIDKLLKENGAEIVYEGESCSLMDLGNLQLA